MPPPTLSRLLAAPIGQAIHRLLLIQAFRPDRLLAMAHMFVSTNLGESFMSIMEQPLDLTHIVGTEVMSQCPSWLPRHHLPLHSSWPQPGTLLLGCNLPKPAPPSGFLWTGPISQLIIFSFTGEAKHTCPDVLCAWV